MVGVSQGGLAVIRDMTTYDDLSVDLGEATCACLFECVCACTAEFKCTAVCAPHVSADVYGQRDILGRCCKLMLIIRHFNL